MTKKLTKPAGTARRAVRNLALLATLAAAICARAATPTISNVKAQQRYPWNGLVDIDYTITGDTTGLNLSFSVRDEQNNKTYTPASFLAPPSAAEGTHRVTWSPKGDGLSIISTNIVVTVLLTRTMVPPTQNGEYLVIDLSGGANASSYPVTYVASVPSGGFNTDEYKTTKLVLRKIAAGSFNMSQGGTNVPTTISKPFYIGVFEVTQRQYELVMGSNPCSSTSYGKGDDYPVHYVSYNDIRGSSNGAGWPASSTVDGDSFLGKIQSRTGLALDLPTEAQWEYACRAGTTTTYSYGDSADGQYMWYSDNSSSTSHTVGTKLPNTWGLYDMHGNLFEWSLDWKNGSLVGGTDPKGSLSGSLRILRGGSWYNDASYCTSSGRYNISPSSRGNILGFRLCCSAGLEPAGEHDMVQLWEGGPYWATTNIGAEKPEDYGYYFWWGDTVGYTRSGGTLSGNAYSNVTWVSSTGQQMSSSPFSSSSCPTYGKDDAERR